MHLDICLSEVVYANARWQENEMATEEQAAIKEMNITILGEWIEVLKAAEKEMWRRMNNEERDRHNKATVEAMTDEELSEIKKLISLEQHRRVNEAINKPRT